MYIEMGCFVSCLCGWILICSTMATEYWIVSESAEVVLNAGMYYSNLWMDCLADSTGVSDCRYFPSMMNLSVFLHVSRALAVVSVILGFWAAVLALIGMKCTKIGGSELINARVTFAAALTYMLSGFCGMIVYSWWGEKTRVEFLDPYFLEIKSELGAGLFIGWGGSCLIICGSAVMCYFSGRESFPQRLKAKPRRPPIYMTARTRRLYMLPGSSRPTTVIVPSIYQSQGESRGSQLRTGRRETQESRPPPPPIDSAV
ncbi:claudin-10-like [Triplophysa dalaica]|uniref:claudin-10-like n=1 Tax=Triplophysa dalaica TaxID=1582913 RepID=UPI0024DF7CE1|nr:claudin-10-like [Triplophysa dalaica]